LLLGDVGDRDAHDLDELVQGGDLGAVHVVGLYGSTAGPGSRRTRASRLFADAITRKALGSSSDRSQPCLASAKLGRD
jgi:hypothetical protein